MGFFFDYLLFHTLTKAIYTAPRTAAVGDEQRIKETKQDTMACRAVCVMVIDYV